MQIQPNLDGVIDIARPVLADAWRKLFYSETRILFAVDTEISLSPGNNSFGVERVIRLLRESTVGCVHFAVDVALRSADPFAVVENPIGTEARYTGFRFDSVLPDGSTVLSNYDQVWCFGFKPGNDDGPDANIEAPSALPTSDAELAVLVTWMNQGGGVFATGDHDYLGASLCHRIPRVGTMRAWTNAQGVPPIGGPLRIDTNRPGNAAEVAGTEVIEFDRQSDTTPQSIEWSPWLSYRHPFLPRARIERPHPILCHPTLGPINVMPDHPHEGVVFDHVAQPDVGLAPITLGNDYDFNGVNGSEYPSVGGVQALPAVIAYGRTLADPPLMHEKGDSPAKRFAMISAYDGHRVNVGRVATDSTWHHWMNLNIADIEAAGGDGWEKVRRYYLNLAVWLAPARIPRKCLYFHLLESLYSYPGIEEFRVNGDPLQMGVVLRKYLATLYGPCWVTHFVIDWLGVLDIDFRERFINKYVTVPGRPVPVPPPCLSCPSPDMLEAMVLGGLIVSTKDQVFGDNANIDASLRQIAKLNPDSFEKRLVKGTTHTIDTVRKLLIKSFDDTKELLRM